MKNKIFFFNQLCKKASLVIFLGLLMSVTSEAQLPTAQEISSRMKVGCNLGNTLEAICAEDAWGGGKTSQRLIDSMRVAGFNAIRLPCSWFCHSDTVTNVINATWIARVKEVVDYCIKDSMYTILNIHWDQGWLDAHINAADSAKVKVRQHAYWTQIANYFNDFDEHLLFAGSNEPPAKDSTGMAILLSYHQTFIDAVRATGGNNSSRTLIVQGPSTDVDLTYKLMNTMPTDAIKDRLMVEVHYYTPYQFCLMNSDANWGKMFYYWGKGNHSTTDVQRNSTWGEESDVEKYFGMMKTKFVDKGIPVIIGEYGAYKRNLSPPSNQALNNASVEYYQKYIVNSTTSKGIIPFYWDTPGGLFNRSTGAIQNRDILNAIMQGVKGALNSIYVSKENDTVLYPNPFLKTITFNISHPDDVVSITIFDLTGKQVETLNKSAITNTLVIGLSYKPDTYLVKVLGTNWSKSFKIIKM